ncbi:MAG: inositol monophosphatase [Bdellovibrionales bacterium]|nr:inositol monophosphatase [Bdellovibrionales bacterium]
MWPMIDLKKAEKVALKAALLGREVLLSYFGQLSNVAEKNQAGLVSEADLESERVISEYILKEFPETTIFAEEGSYNKPGQSPDMQTRQKGVWLIDPLDGTTNYVHKFPIYCVSIGLEYAGELVVAACDVPALKKTYTATRGGGAYADGQRLSVSSQKTLSESLLATGFSAYDITPTQLKIFGSLMQEVRGVRRAGSAAFDLCLVAEGVFDAYWEKNLSPWDTAAGALLVTEAGGVVTTYDSDSYSPFDKTIVAGNKDIHGLVRDRIQRLSF